MREVKRTRLDLDFQALVAAEQVKGLRTGSPCQKRGAQHLVDRLHGGRLSGRRRGQWLARFGGMRRLWIRRGWAFLWLRRMRSLLEVLLEGEARRGVAHG